LVGRLGNLSHVSVGDDVHRFFIAPARKGLIDSVRNGPAKVQLGDELVGNTAGIRNGTAETYCRAEGSRPYGEKSVTTSCSKPTISILFQILEQALNEIDICGYLKGGRDQPGAIALTLPK